MSLCRDEHNAPLYFITHSEDITARKQAAEDAELNDTQYRTLFNSCNDAVFVLGLREDGMPTNFLQVNDVACQRLGYSREELLQRSVRDIYAPEDASQCPAIVARLLS